MVREVEMRVRTLHAARSEGCDAPPIDTALYAKFDERRKLGAPSICAAVEGARIGGLVHELSPRFNEPIGEREFVSQYNFPVHSAPRASRLDLVERVVDVAASIHQALPNVPWRVEGAAAHLVLAGGALLRHMARRPGNLFSNSDYDFFLVAATDAAARLAITAVDRWVADRCGRYYMIARTANAVTFLTGQGVYQVVLRLYGPAAENEPDEVKCDSAAPATGTAAGTAAGAVAGTVASTAAGAVASTVAGAAADTATCLIEGIEQIICGFDIDICTFAFDGRHVWTIPRGERALRANVIMIDPERLSLSALHRFRKYLDRGCNLGLAGLTAAAYARMRTRKPAIIAHFINNDPSRGLIERLLCGQGEAVKVDYAPEFSRIRLNPTSWASSDQRFRYFIRKHADALIYNKSTTVVFTQNVAAVLDTPAGKTPAELRELAGVSLPETVYTAPRAPANSITFLRRLGHGQLSGSYHPVVARNFYPQELPQELPQGAAGAQGAADAI